MSLIVLDTNPASLVSANRRIHWSKRAELQRHWRVAACVAARNVSWAVGGPDLAGGKAAIVVTFRFPDKRRRDTANLAPLVVKPAIDGLVDAGWLPDDSDTYVDAVTIRRDPEPGPHRVTITVERAA